MEGSGTDPAVIGVYVDVAAAHDGDYVSAGEAVTVFEDRRDAERGRWFDDEASVSSSSRIPAMIDAVSDGVDRVGGDDAPFAP